jgi:hypothetical protein
LRRLPFAAGALSSSGDFGSFMDCLKGSMEIAADMFHVASPGVLNGFSGAYRREKSSSGATLAGIISGFSRVFSFIPAGTLYRGAMRIEYRPRLSPTSLSVLRPPPI